MISQCKNENCSFRFLVTIYFLADIDECASDPCQNAGTCNDGVASYTCDCAVGFNGTHCEIR